MASPVNAVTGVHAETAPATADLIAENRERQAERLRAAQAETTRVGEVVEAVTPSDRVAVSQPRDMVDRYRTNFGPGFGQLITEVLDTETGKVLLRIPPIYASPAAEAEGPEERAGTAEPARSEVQA